MNQFTKSELETIYLDMNHTILKYGKGNVAKFYLELRDKVEALIDRLNCVHESNGIRYAIMKISALDEREYEYRCKHCGEYFDADKT